MKAKQAGRGDYVHQPDPIPVQAPAEPAAPVPSVTDPIPTTVETPHEE